MRGLQSSSRISYVGNHRERIPCPHPGRIWLHQRGVHSAMYWHIEASVVLDLQEFPHSAEGKELQFSMVDGDFKLYAGRWFLQPGSKLGTTILRYEVNVIPRLLFPAAFVENIIKADLPLNLCALAERAEADSALWGMPSKTFKSIGAMSLTPSRSLFTKTSGDLPVKAAFNHHQDSSKFSSKKMSLDIPVSVVLQDKRLNPVQAYSQKINSLGVLVAADKTWSGTKGTYKANRSCCVDEVHLRRLNDPLTSGQHWRVITAITVEAPIEDVWAVLTAYEKLPEFIPNLSQSKVLYREENHVRILQEGCKCLLYMVLHARVVLDLFENPKFEIAFQQVEGDFDSFHGRWTLDALGNQHTLLKYVVDMKMHKDFLLPETIVEEVVYEDLPENLCAIRDRVELGQASFKVPEKNYKHGYEGSEDSNNNANAPQSVVLKNDNVNLDTETCASKLSKKRKTPVAGLQREFGVLEKELLRFIAENGKMGVMPMRWQLRHYGRIDLEKAIARMGGFIRVAARLGLSLTYKQRKPKGYWDNLENIRQEILVFQKDNGEETTIMPTRKSLEKAGRFDIARALEKWGGLLEVAQMLGLKTRRGVTFKKDKFLENEETTTHDTSGRKVPLKMSFPVKSLKWLKTQHATRQ
ncbi:hypothetical protein O6H91_20G034800 [Diphasiastrum complanatum]|uniref:Uncharacterized protein n=2 Tax=Diphasiastrum complanatum TaxID=34168 RepID=A0ACC2APC9_DIPCM|nr:hypothetical protein O6H91_20G034100 [Diphasiastrum complanatum]KAJ7519336.1 hypothetical protein O6H91_20G034800 [Diphasiastrum complanatum]